MPLPAALDAPAPTAPAPRMDRDGDTIMSGVNALSSTKDAQIAALTAQVVAPRWCARSRGGNSAGDSRPYPPAISMDVRRQRLTNGHCERCDADPSHRWNDCRYQNFQSSPTVSDPRRANVNNIAATVGKIQSLTPVVP